MVHRVEEPGLSVASSAQAVPAPGCRLARRRYLTGTQQAQGAATTRSWSGLMSLAAVDTPIVCIRLAFGTRPRHPTAILAL